MERGAVHRMKMYVGVTDKNWFQFLAERAPDEVNFWRPGGNAAFRASYDAAARLQENGRYQSCKPAISSHSPKDGPNLVSNGLLLRSDLHILFDRGYLTVNPDLRVEVSPRIREEFSNGREYYALHGKPLVATPSSILDRPSNDFLDWHNQNIFVR